MLDPAASVRKARVRHARWLVLAVAFVTLALKLTLAATTYGTNDIYHWLTFVQAVHTAGPIHVYGVSIPYKVDGHIIQLYNHPPLIGYFLQSVLWLEHLGLSAQFTIRATASLADVGTAVLVFELLRRRGSLGRATAGALIVAASPVLFVISGFHGNTDPIFVMFVLLSVYLLADRNLPALGGAALALALGVKIVPVVVVPCLLIYALTRGWRYLLRYGGGLVVVSALFWGPALALEGPAVRKDVLGYVGLNSHEWGADLIAIHERQPALATWIEGPGRLLIVLACTAVAALLVWWRPDAVAEGVSLALCSFLVLTPSFGTQYLVWAAAPIVVLTVWGGLAYNVLAGILLAKVYTRWDGGLPWDHAHASPFNSSEKVLGLFVWLVLGVATVLGAVRALSTRPTPLPPDEPAGIALAASSHELKVG